MIYEDAHLIARDIQDRLAPACQRIEIAGSLRRKLSSVGDIELVAVPIATYALDLFGEPTGAPINHLEEAIARLPGKLMHRNGPAFKQFGYIGGATIDLFIVTPETWGIQFLIRTGGEEFSHWMVTSRTADGALPVGFQVRDGRLWKLGQPLNTPEEIDVFNAIGLPFIPPEQRSGHGWFRQGQ
jgi:DNA polymerase (family 10)